MKIHDSIRNYLPVAAVLLALVSVTYNQPQTSVESLLKSAKSAEQANNLAEAISVYEKALQMDPHNFAAHNGLVGAKKKQLNRMLSRDGQPASEEERGQINAKRKANETETRAKYEQLEQKFPERAVYKVILASLNVYEPAKALSYLESAVRAEPNNLDALNSLGLFELSRGNFRKASENFGMVAQSRPDDPEVAFYLLYATKHVDTESYKRKTFEFIDRYPSDRRAIGAANFLIEDTEDPSTRERYYNQFRKIFPPEKSEAFNNALTGLFAIYSESEPDKALALAEEMVELSATDAQKKSWQGYVDYQSAIVEATKLITDKNPAGAIAILEKAKAPRFLSNTSPFYSLKARAADAAGRTTEAYNELAEYYISKPRKVVRVYLESLGRKLGKDKTHVEKDIQSKVVSRAKPIKDFSLVRFDTGTKVSLADYRGKVVLLNFWYPLCGPCHGEAPFLQKMTERYGKDGFVILAVNVHPKEDILVLPYFQTTKFNFVPLKVPDEDFAEREYQARGFPTNYLIDRQGRHVFNIGVIHRDVWEEAQQKVEIALTF